MRHFDNLMNKFYSSSIIKCGDTPESHTESEVLSSWDSSSGQLNITCTSDVNTPDKINRYIKYIFERLYHNHSYFPIGNNEYCISKLSNIHFVFTNNNLYNITFDNDGNIWHGTNNIQISYTYNSKTNEWDIKEYDDIVDVHTLDKNKCDNFIDDINNCTDIDCDDINVSNNKHDEFITYTHAAEFRNAILRESCQKIDPEEFADDLCNAIMKIFTYKSEYNISHTHDLMIFTVPMSKLVSLAGYKQCCIKYIDRHALTHKLINTYHLESVTFDERCGETFINLFFDL